jgi:competence protein ComEC
LVSGDCSLIITETKKTILLDGGNCADYDYGENVVMPYLLKHGIASLDYIIISHFDNDHCGGLKFILNNLKVKNVIIGVQYEEYENYRDILNIINNKKINLIVVKAGDILNIDKNTYLEIIFPDTKSMIEENSINNNSLVAKLCYKNTSILFTGDIEALAEEAILKLYTNNLSELNSTILKVAHHGSNTSSTENFIKIVNPKISLIGVGKNNKYGHPGLEVLTRLKSFKSKVYRTDEDGEISIKINRNGNIKIEKYQKKL